MHIFVSYVKQTVTDFSRSLSHKFEQFHIQKEYIKTTPVGT